MINAQRSPDISALPDHYYLAHFEEMISAVIDHSAHLLNHRQTEFQHEFSKLGRSERCLYVRLVNRRNRVFDANRLRYPEIPNLAQALSSLASKGWIEPAGVEQLEDLMRFSTREKLEQALRMSHAGLPRNWSKSQYMNFVRAHGNSDDLLENLSSPGVFVRRYQAITEYFLFLYFGKITNGLSRFTRRDLGVLRVNDSKGKYQTRFETREQALEQFFYARALKRLNQEPAGELSELLEQLKRWDGGWKKAHSDTHEKLIIATAKRLESQQETQEAIECLRLGHSTASLRRVIRLMLASDRREEAHGHLQSCLAHASDGEVLSLAEDLLVRKFKHKKTSDLTDVLRDAASICLDDAWIGMPEQAAIDYFERQGARAYRSENRLWRSYFGLIFWDLLFAEEGKVNYSPFDTLPVSLTDGSFAKRHAVAIEERCEQLADVKKTRLRLLKSLSRNHGKENALFQWSPSLAEKVLALNESTLASAQGEILKAMATDYQKNKHGFPDLLVIENGKGRFVEIKAQGDQLKRNQLTRIQQLRNAGLPAEVLRIDWVVHPEQDYVVLDVETTGGRGEQHRVTEIGAVKIRNGHSIAEFQTLLNPERRIPGHITRLTGISEEMVATAPRFVDIADQLEEFLDGAVFVAHNVNFDYGFIKSEFRRIGRHFKHPRFCTCTQMRRHFPGAKSYSLKNLCNRYDIDLSSHHRALCDAKAAAQLLCMINEKRQANSAAQISSS